MDELLTLASDRAMEAGNRLLDRLGNDSRPIQSETATGDVVTEVAHESESPVIQRLLAARPDDGVTAEERGASPAAPDSPG